MKKRNYILITGITIALLASCVRELPLEVSSGGTALPEGKYPLVLTATGLTAAAAPVSRATVDGDWEGVSSVAVEVDGVVKKYEVTSSTDKTTTLTSDDPHYWTSRDAIQVTAWWPYTKGETAMPVVKVASDQSTQDDYEGSDFIAAESQMVTFDNPTLRFTHRTARVTVVLTDYTEELMSVQLTGLSTENGNPPNIVPYDKGSNTYTALVAPQSVAKGTAFITCAFTNGKIFVYRMQKAAEWKAGEEYTYTVSLAAAKDPGYTISEDGKTYTVTSAEGLKNLAKLVNEQWNLGINITLTADIDLSGIDWTPIGIDYNHQYTGTFDGNGKTITGLTVTGSNEYAGLFGRIGSGGKVQNVKLEGVQIESNNEMSGVGGVAGRNFKDSMFGGGIITACYWGDNGQEQGIGEDQVGTGETTKVTDGNWLGAKDAMNAALNGKGWRYELGTDDLPVLKKI